MRFLVTGGAGFLGAALANRLAADGHLVMVLDDLSNGAASSLRPEVAFTQGDVRNIPLLWSLLRDVDCVYHLAAKVSVAESVLHPQAYNEVNVGGTVSLMEAMRDTGVRRVVFTSSGAVYGRLQIQPVHENDAPNPDSPYAVSKWAAEQYIHTIGRLNNIETVALRIFNAYGPGQSLPVSHAPVIPRFLQQALTGGSLVLHGNGEQTRDFVYLTDVVEAMVAAATATAVNRQVINVGSGVETSLNQLVSEIEQVIGKHVNQLHNQQKSAGAPRLVADISRARQLLGFLPLVELVEGLQCTLREDGRFRQQK
ncbi:MAG: NAD-dependent epimerase/dehydratase family protein [Ardenticatenaceae bacterium]|nr:NAD-dependent epimerase/dehydratase family protein [Anaerolineales bacterium]MCB8977097.1 NAD-dependent epimerase/dehydratase family protein [Ardenticatenaceae bacterium]